MRQPRQLNTKHIKARRMEELAFMSTEMTIRVCMPEDLKELLRDYIVRYPTTWWIQANKDFNKQLEILFSSSFYSEQQFGVHNLKPEFLEAVKRGLNME